MFIAPLLRVAIPIAEMRSGVRILEKNLIPGALGQVRIPGHQSEDALRTRSACLDLRLSIRIRALIAGVVINRSCRCHGDDGDADQDQSSHYVSLFLNKSSND
jgi:hypothetical protein